MIMNNKDEQIIVLQRINKVLEKMAFPEELLLHV